MDNVKKYLETLTQVLNKVYDTQAKNLNKVADLMADAIANRKGVYAFGPSHAGMMVEEMVYRAGGLAVMNPIHASALLPNARPMTITTSMERLPGYASILLESSSIKPGDFLLIHSVSGRIPIVIEMAIKAKEMGVHVAGIINMDYATKSTSLDPSGKMLYEVCDVVIDNCGVFGDASIHIDGVPQPVAPTSTVSGAFIVNSLVILVCEKLLARGIEPPVLRSGNIDGANEINAKLFEAYKDVIHYLD
ncbi:MAG: sugar isomerase domain-containing protein [Bacillota bacterium]